MCPAPPTTHALHVAVAPACIACQLAIHSTAPLDPFQTNPSSCPVRLSDRRLVTASLVVGNTGDHVLELLARHKARRGLGANRDLLPSLHGPNRVPERGRRRAAGALQRWQRTINGRGFCVEHIVERASHGRSLQMQCCGNQRVVVFVVQPRIQHIWHPCFCFSSNHVPVLIMHQQQQASP